MKNIVVLIDLTRISDAALAHAAMIARSAKAKLILLHVASPDRSHVEDQLIGALKENAAYIGKMPADLEYKVVFGSFFDIIGGILNDLQADLVVVGTHGLPGNDGNFYTQKISTLLKSLTVPKIVIQGHRDLLPEPLYNWMVAKAGGPSVLAKVQWLADAYKSEIHQASQVEDLEELETEAFDEDCALLVWQGDIEKGKDLIFNSFGIPVLMG
jgi:nucleotide-binding universal stress UspA family protein